MPSGSPASAWRGWKVGAEHTALGWPLRPQVQMLESGGGRPRSDAQLSATNECFRLMTCASPTTGLLGFLPLSFDLVG
jgi:hypothetical protein